jgi:UDP-N-acetylmuramoyl-L-alanyl-D-glutamate--2,6-diaminopimelate ligase
LKEVCELVINIFSPKRLLLLIGSAGGVRDKWKRPILGETGITYANELVITNEDPYDEDPLEIMRSIESGVKKYLMEFGIEKPYKIIEDRGEAIEYLIKRASKGDIVLITGKGNEKFIRTKDRDIPWSDRKKVMEVLNLKT